MLPAQEGPPQTKQVGGFEGMESRQANVEMFLGFSNAHPQPTATEEGSSERVSLGSNPTQLLFPQKELLETAASICRPASCQWSLSSYSSRAESLPKAL